MSGSQTPPQQLLSCIISSIVILVFGLRYEAPMNVLASGAYGYGNFGDDCYVDVLRSRMAGRNLDFLSQVDETELRLFSYDATMLAGGGLIYDLVAKCGTRSLKHYLRYPAIAQWLGKKSFMIGVGVQGRIHPQALEPYLSVFEGMDLRTVRDNYSARILREAGVRSSILECADLVYAKTILPKTDSAGRHSGKPVLGIVASQPGKGFVHDEFNGFEDRFRQALRILEKDFRLHFFSFDSRADPWLAESWRGNYSYTSFDMKSPDAINEFIASIQMVDAFVTTRYHGAVLSILTGTPFLGIGAPAEKIQRECQAIRYPQYLSYASTAEQFVESVSETWSEREGLGELLRHAAPRRKQLAHRNFQLMASEHESPERNGTRMIPHLAASIRNSSSFRTLVVWAAGQDCWSEASGLFAQLREFDCVLPPNAAQRHIGIDQRFLLPEPGIFNWIAFPDDLKGRLALNYDNVIVCHEGAAGKTIDLLGIGVETGKRIWDFDLWRHSIRSVSESDLAVQRDHLLRTQGVTA
jgi:polysaccharide pyruvyl transferase WcaK-like protein